MNEWMNMPKSNWDSFPWGPTIPVPSSKQNYHPTEPIQLPVGYLGCAKNGPPKRCRLRHLPGTLNNHFFMDLWWNNRFLCSDLESSNWNNHKKNWLFGVPGRYLWRIGFTDPPTQWKRFILESLIRCRSREPRGFPIAPIACPWATWKKNLGWHSILIGS